MSSGLGKLNEREKHIFHWGYRRGYSDGSFNKYNNTIEYGYERGYMDGISFSETLCEEIDKIKKGSK